MVTALVIVALLIAWRIRAGRRRNRLAGLTATAPTFSIAPPTRYTTTRRDHRL